MVWLGFLLGGCCCAWPPGMKRAEGTRPPPASLSPRSGMEAPDRKTFTVLMTVHPPNTQNGTVPSLSSLSSGSGHMSSSFLKINVATVSRLNRSVASILLSLPSATHPL